MTVTVCQFVPFSSTDTCKLFTPTFTVTVAVAGCDGACRDRQSMSDIQHSSLSVLRHLQQEIPGMTSAERLCSAVDNCICNSGVYCIHR